MSNENSSGCVRVDAPARQQWIVELAPPREYFGEWLAPWPGDPGRTCVRESAKRYNSEHAGKCALARARRVYPDRKYLEARVVVAQLGIRQCEHGPEASKCPLCCEKQAVPKCPWCGGLAENGQGRSFPPDFYLCSKCVDSDRAKRNLEANLLDLELS